MAVDTTLVDLFSRSVREYAPHPVLGTKRAGAYVWSTYAELGRKVDAVSRALAAAGLKPGDRVAVISANREEWAVLAYAAYRLGGVVVPMYESQSPDDWTYIINDAAPTVLALSTPKIYGRIQNFLQNCPSVRHLVMFEGGGGETLAFSSWLQTTAPAAQPPAVSPQDLAGLIYTSGTTGRPKGVMLSHGNIVSNVNAGKQLFPLGPGDSSLSFLPWAHAFGQVVELHMLVSMGAAMGLAERVDTLLDNLLEVRPTMLVAVPRIFNRIYEGVNLKIEEEGGLRKRLFTAGLANSARLRNRELRHEDSRLNHLSNRVFDKLVFSKVKARFGGRLKYAFSGGAALAPEVARFIDQLNIRVYEGYGLSETSPIITANYIGHRKIGSVGRPIPGVTIKIDAAKGTMPGEGEILCYGPNVMQGYYHLPEQTAEALMQDGGLRTGDLGYVDEDGYLYVTGRVKDLYKLQNGKYVAPVPLEEELQLSPYILQAMLYGPNLPSNVALVVPEEAGLRRYAEEHGLAAASLAEMLGYGEITALLEREVARIAANWKSYERPVKVIPVTEEWTVDNGLLTPTLKVVRRKVVARYQDLLEGRPAPAAAPRHEAPRPEPPQGSAHARPGDAKPRAR